MTQPTRKLAAILAADVVNYTSLMGEDETRTLAALNTLREKLFQPKVVERNGEIIKRMGDGWLVEFANVSEAVTCAIEIQEGLSSHNFIRLRMGVHIGDVTFQEDDIYGDGINIAARLETMAEPGQVLISDTVHHSLDNKSAGQFDGGAAQQLKNVSRAVGVWYWPATSELDATASNGNGETTLALPDKPSIAVLPFDNMSGDPEQEYFSDGITEDIITALSKFRWFFVTARNSTFKYKGAAIDIKQVGRELGVRYVLEGSVRKGGDRIRITAQLIEAETGNHIWAERYDRDLDDVFELQDEITLTIAAAVEPELASSERQRSIRKPTSDLRAWDLFQRGSGKIITHDRDGVMEGADLMKQAISKDPNFGLAYGYLALSIVVQSSLGRVSDSQSILKQGVENAKRAISIDQQDFIARYALGRLLLLQGDREGAIQEFEFSLGINPNSTWSYFGLADAMNIGEEFVKALEYIECAIRLSPNDALLWLFYTTKSIALKGLGEFEKAIEIQEHVCRSANAFYMQYLSLTTAYALAGRHDEATKTLARAREIEPNLSVAFYRTLVRDNNFMSEKRLGQMVDLLRMSGLPEN